MDNVKTYAELKTKLICVYLVTLNLLFVSAIWKYTKDTNPTPALYNNHQSAETRIGKSKVRKTLTCDTMEEEETGEFAIQTTTSFLTTAPLGCTTCQSSHANCASKVSVQSPKSVSTQMHKCATTN